MHASLLEADVINRNELKDRQGRSFKEWKRGLTPRWWRVWADIACGYLVVAAIVTALAWLDGRYPQFLFLWVVLGAFALGYTIAFIQLFFHEAAHFNIAPGRKLNDLMANVFIGLMIGQDVKAYRTVHFDHHRYLGTPQDTERSYFDSLNARFVFESLVGIKLLAVFSRRSARVERKVVDPARASWARRRRLVLLLAGFTLNLGIILGALWWGHVSVAVAWVLGMAAVHPLVNAVRQLLEHRSFFARSDIDYASEPHGPATRMFGRGPIASTFGGAGFNRHLLHHWEPQISYTRLAELEVFLLDTPCAPTFRKATTTYGRAIVRLWRAA